MVMCKQPAMRAPFKGLDSPYSALKAIKPGISASAKPISLRPHSANEMSATLYFTKVSTILFSIFLNQTQKYLKCLRKTKKI